MKISVLQERKLALNKSVRSLTHCLDWRVVDDEIKVIKKIHYYTETERQSITNIRTLKPLDLFNYKSLLDWH